MMRKPSDDIQKHAQNVEFKRVDSNQKIEVEDVFNLLNFQKQKQQQKHPTQPSTPVQRNTGNKNKPKRARARKPGLKPPPVYPPKSRKRRRQTLKDLLKARKKIKPPPPFIVPKVFLMDMGKKKKRHPTVTGQFEDAVDSKQYHDHISPANDLIQSAPSIGRTSRNHANRALASNYQLLMEQQAQERRRLERLTASRLRGQQFSVFIPDDFATERSAGTEASKKAKADTKAFSKTKKSYGGIYDDAEMPDATKAFAIGNIPAASLLQRAPIFGSNVPAPTLPTIPPHAANIQASRIPPTIPAHAANFPPATPKKMAIYSPSAKSVITIPVPLTAAFSDTLLQSPSRAVVEVGQHRKGYEDYLPPLKWGEMCTAPHMAPVRPDSNKEHPVQKIRPYDVLYGRGGLTNINPGNIQLRNLVAKLRMAYFAAPKGVKRSLSKTLLNYVRSKGGRFLEKYKQYSDWYEVGDEKALLKCSQAMRDGAHDLVKTTK